MNAYRKIHPYTLFYNDKEYAHCKDWEEALHLSEYQLNRIGAKLGITSIDIKKQFIKNEPKISFSEVHDILNEMGVL